MEIVEFGPLTMPQSAMWPALRANGKWPNGTLIIHSLPF